MDPEHQVPTYLVKHSSKYLPMAQPLTYMLHSPDLHNYIPAATEAAAWI